MSEPTPQPQTTQKGERGFELDATVTFGRPRSLDEVGAVLRGFGGILEPYGRAQLRALLESGEALRVEIGQHGFLRSVTGQTDWVPWKRNVVLGRNDWEKVSFEEGLRYVLE
jgi:hypothetical protein